MATSQNTDPDNMSFLDHLEVLRWHIVRSALAILLFAISAFVFKSFVFDVLILGPKQGDFITYRALCRLSAYLQELAPFMFAPDALCIGQDFPKLVNLTMAGQFTTHIVTAIVVGIIAAFPYVLYEIWRFISPGLNPVERKMAGGFVGSASILFFVGVTFGYLIICPLSINFFLNYHVSPEVANQPTLSTYISLVTSVLLACGFVFELPVIVYLLSRLGVLTPRVMKAYRKHAIVGCLVLSAVITPPDVFSQILVAFPLLFLYELSIMISGFVQRTMNKSRP